MASSTLRVTLLAVILCSTIAITPIVLAQESTPSESTFQDSDGDGDPDIVEITTSFSKDIDEGRVYIVDRGDSMKQTENPRGAIDYRDDVLIYDANFDGSAELFIRFDRRDGNYTAALYDTRDGDQQYDLSGDSIQLPTPETPQVRLTSDTPWIRNGAVSYNLEIECKSGTRCSFEDSKSSAQANISVVDANGDGTPEYEVRQVTFPRLGTNRTDLMVNRGTEQTLSPNSGVIWPYIGAASDNGFVRPPGSATPPIQVDWTDGEIETIGEFVASRGDEDNYFVYTRNKLARTGINEPSFEFPFGFYDLASDDDGIPELQVRMRAYSKGARGGLGLYPNRLPFDLSFSRYSWDQTNNGRWDYKIGVIGTNGYADVQQVGDYRLRMPEYETLPMWVNDHEWRTASFVAVTNGTEGSEGIYAGGYQTSELRRQVLGLDSTSKPLMNNPEPGYRIEFAPEYVAQPQVYYSPIDRALHLYNLEYGTWNRTGASDVRYRNVDDDPFVDAWITDEPQEQRLIAEDDHLVYAEKETISFKRTSVKHTEFVTSPPATTEEWERLGNHLSGSPAETLDLQNTFRGYEGERFEVTNAEFTDYTPTEDGFRIYATIPSESRIRGNTSQSLPDAEQVVFVFDEQRAVEVHEATPPSLSITNTATEDEPITPLEQNTIDVTVQNEGWQTAQNITVALTDDDRVIANRTVSVVGKQTQTAQLQWWPRMDYTEATIEVRFDGETVATQSLTQSSEHRTAPTLLTRFAISNRSVPITLGMGITVSIGLLVISRRVFR
jgi:hypothetical protein